MQLTKRRQINQEPTINIHSCQIANDFYLEFQYNLKNLSGPAY
jgi:hypothetical protein